MMRRRLLTFSLAVAMAAAYVTIAAAQSPSISIVDVGLRRITIAVTAGTGGTPNGYSMQWMKKADFTGTWPDEGTPGLMYCECYGPYTLNMYWDDGRPNSPIMGEGETSFLQLGDLGDESGLYGNDYNVLETGTEYVARAYVQDGNGDVFFSNTIEAQTITPECTQGFWGTHGPGACHAGNNPNVWPASCFPMELGLKNDAGSFNYTDLQICSIFQASVSGNGLISLAHQLATTKLNGCSTSDLTPVAATLAAAQALIGSLNAAPSKGPVDFIHPSQTSALTEVLDDYNNGLLGGVANCPTPVQTNTTWGRLKVLYR